jgi:hypothetical protein
MCYARKHLQELRHWYLYSCYNILGVYVHHKQAWENKTPERQSPAFKADGYSMFTLIPCGGVGRCLCATRSPVVSSGHPPNDR